MSRLTPRQILNIRELQRRQFVKRRRQHPYLLTAHISKRHLLGSSPKIAS